MGTQIKLIKIVCEPNGADRTHKQTVVPTILINSRPGREIKKVDFSQRGEKDSSRGRLNSNLYLMISQPKWFQWHIRRHSTNYQTFVLSFLWTINGKLFKIIDSLTFRNDKWAFPSVGLTQRCGAMIAYFFSAINDMDGSQNGGGNQLLAWSRHIVLLRGSESMAMLVCYWSQIQIKIQSNIQNSWRVQSLRANVTATSMRAAGSFKFTLNRADIKTQHVPAYPHYFTAQIWKQPVP